MTGKKWSEYDMTVLADVEATLSMKYPSCIIDSATAIATEEKRLISMFLAGQASVATEIRNEIKRRTKSQ